MAASSSKFVPVHLIGKLTASSRNLAGANDSAFHQLSSRVFHKDFYTDKELLDTLVVDDSSFTGPDKEVYKDLSLGIWSCYSARLVAALESPDTFSDSWKALVKLAVYDFNFASSVFQKVSKDKLFTQKQFRKIWTGTSESPQANNLITIALKEDPSFAKNALTWGYYLEFMKDGDVGKGKLTLSKLDSLEANVEVVSKIESGQISKEGVQKYLKWANHPFRFIDRIIFAIAGPSYFDRNNLPYPPSKKFKEAINKAFKNIKLVSNQPDSSIDPSKASELSGSHVQQQVVESTIPQIQPGENIQLIARKRSSAQFIESLGKLESQQKNSLNSLMNSARKSVKRRAVKLVQNETVSRLSANAVDLFLMFAKSTRLIRRSFIMEKLEQTEIAALNAGKNTEVEYSKPVNDVEKETLPTTITEQESKLASQVTPVKEKTSKQLLNVRTPDSTGGRSPQQKAIFGTPNNSDGGRSPQRSQTIFGTPDSAGAGGRSPQAKNIFGTPDSTGGRSPQQKTIFGTPDSTGGRSPQQKTIFGTPDSTGGRSPQTKTIFGTPDSTGGRSPQSQSSSSSHSSGSSKRSSASFAFKWAVYDMFFENDTYPEKLALDFIKIDDAEFKVLYNIAENYIRLKNTTTNELYCGQLQIESSMETGKLFVANLSNECVYTGDIVISSEGKIGISNFNLTISANEENNKASSNSPRVVELLSSPVQPGLEIETKSIERLKKDLSKSYDLNKDFSLTDNRYVGQVQRVDDVATMEVLNDVSQQQFV